MQDSTSLCRNFKEQKKEKKKILDHSRAYKQSSTRNARSSKSRNTDDRSIQEKIGRDEKKK